MEYYAEDGTLTAGKVRLIDFERPAKDDAAWQWYASQIDPYHLFRRSRISRAC